MSIRDYEGDIHRDFNVLPPNVYIGEGQGCSTIWYYTVPQARKARKNRHIPSGYDAKLCRACACACSVSDPCHKYLREFICGEYKNYWTLHQRAPEGA